MLVAKDDDRAWALCHWAEAELHLGKGSSEFTMVSGDASFRRYFRLRSGEKSWIAVEAPPETENNPAFVDIATRLKHAGVSVPEVLSWHQQQGYLLLSDLGDQQLLGLLQEASVERWYGQAMEQLSVLAKTDTSGLPRYDGERLLSEMQLFSDWFVTQLLQLQLSEQEQALQQQLFQRLVDSALEQPQGFVHRDYHSRNIMVQGDTLAAIDFQDAVAGPVSYDLVSLIRDCYIVWPAEQVQAWSEQYRALACPEVAPSQWQRWLDWMGLQRHIKVLGIFARLWLRDGKSGYLADLPLVIWYTVSVAQQYPELEEWVAWFKQRLRVAILAQDWAQTAQAKTLLAILDESAD